MKEEEIKTVVELRIPVTGIVKEGYQEGEASTVTVCLHVDIGTDYYGHVDDVVEEAARRVTDALRKMLGETNGS